MSGECEACGEHCLDCKCLPTCARCKHNLDLCPADWPWNPTYWICPECESTYVYEKDH